MRTHYEANVQTVNKLITIPLVTKTTLAMKAAAYNLSLSRYIERVLSEDANEEMQLAPYFEEQLEYAPPAEAKAAFAKWRARVQNNA